MVERQLRTAPQLVSNRQFELVQIALSNRVMGTPGDTVHAGCDGPSPLGVLGERFYQWSHELTPSLGGQETLQRRDSGVVAIAHGQIEPGEQDFIIFCLVELQAAVKFVETRFQ